MTQITPNHSKTDAQKIHTLYMRPDGAKLTLCTMDGAIHGELERPWMGSLRVCVQHPVDSTTYLAGGQFQ